MLFHRVVGLPDRGKAGGFGGHNIDTVAEIDGQGGDAGACKFKHFVFDKTVGEHRLGKGESHIVRTDAAARLPG